MKREETPADAMDSVIVECDLADPPQKVWQALTAPELLAAWLMPNDIRLQVGARFTLQEKPGPDGDIECEVLEIEPHRRLRYSWRRDHGPRNAGGRALDTVVTFELAETATGGTRLRLTHSGFPTSLHGPVALLAGSERPEGNLYALRPRTVFIANSAGPIEMRKAA